MNQPAFLETRGVTKDFPGVRALDGVDFRVFGGEVLGLVGENGAGKSTLMRIIGGVYPMGSYGGTVLVNGKPVQFQTPLDAEHAGIAIIHQELSTFQHLTVAENLFVGHLPRKGLFVDWKKIEDEAAQLLRSVGANCSPRDLMGQLSVGTQQLVEIAKALSRKSHVLILDEPTSALSQRESDSLFNLMEQLKAQGKALIYISHKMDEIFSLCDRLVVLRDGKSVHETLTKQTNEQTLISHMVGRAMNQKFPPRVQVSSGKTLLEVKNLTASTVQKTVLKNVNFDLHEGEILGFAGLLGSGRSELLQALFADPALHVHGQILINGRPYAADNSRQALRSGVVLVPEDRKRQSIFPGRSLEENVSQTRLALKKQFSMLRRHIEKPINSKSMTDLRVKTTSLERTIETLSGGNQQKVVLGRALQANPKIILLDEPTRGVDVGAKYEIYEILFELKKRGHGLIVVSSELPELLGICDRVGVLQNGQLKALFSQDRFDPKEIMRFAVGAL